MIIPNELSLRERILRNLVDRFTGMADGQNGLTVTWNNVSRKPLSKTQINEGNSLGIYDTAESKVHEMGFYRCTLTVMVEFFYALRMGDEQSTELNRLLTDIQRAVRMDTTCGGLAINIEEVKNELDIEGPAERIIQGVVEYQVTYRHSVDDPRRYV